jgi:hypothetical protein
MKKLIVAMVVIILSLYATATAFAKGDPGEARKPGPDDIAEAQAELENYGKEIDMLAQLVYAEAGYDHMSKMEQAAVMWVVLNRYEIHMRGSSISRVISAPSQFAYSQGLPVLQQYRDLARDVLAGWILEQRGYESNRVIPRDYLFFAGRHGHNYFRTGPATHDYWDWSYPSPYEEEE